MAVPILIKPDTPESAEEIQQRLHEATIKHAKAILAGLELLRMLDDYSILDVLRGSIGAGDTFITKLAVVTNSPPSINAVRNIVSLAKIFGNIDPDVLHVLAEELTKEKPKEKPAPPPRLFTAIRLFASRDSRRALVGTAAFLQAFGKALAAGKTHR